MPDSELFYRHSGRFEPAGVAWSFTSMVFTGLVLGLIYGVLVWLVPFVYVVFIGTIGLGLLVGYLSAQLSIRAKTRNNALIIAGPILAGLATLYTAWVGYLFAASDWQYLSWNPLDIAATAQRVAETGLWSMSSFTPTGWVLYGIWLIEAGIIVVGSALFGLGNLDDPPFNENADAWCDQSEVLPPAKALSPQTIKQVRQQLGAGDLSCFGLFEPLDNDDAAMHTSFLVRWAAGHEHQQFLTITSITITQDEQGNISTNKNPIANNMIIDPEARAVIDDILASGEQDQPADDPDQDQA